MLITYSNIQFEADIKELPVSWFQKVPQITIRDAHGTYVTLMCMTLVSANNVNDIFSGEEEKMQRAMKQYLKYLKKEVEETENLMKF